MGRHDPKRKEKILAAALEEFSREGFEKATIKRIAARAGLQSPALVYWYFDSKAALLDEVMITQFPHRFGVEVLTEVDDLPPDQVLKVLGRGFLDAMAKTPHRRLFRVIVSEVVRRPELFEHFATEGPVKLIGSLRGYLEEQVRRGTMREHDSEAVARWFLFGLLGYLLHREFIPAFRKALPEQERYLDTLINVMMKGLSVPGKGQEEDET